MAIRCVHESKMHDANCAITLTYSNETVSTSLIYKDFQQFLRRLRKFLKKDGRKVRFFMCGEYGDIYKRPHFHAILFGIDFSWDRTKIRTTQAGTVLYKSKTLDDLWGKGLAEIGDCTYEAAAYIARYCLKKVTGDDEYARKHYEAFDIFTGEITQRVPEMARMSLRPGIGLSYLRKYRRDFLNVGALIVDGRRKKLPRYYADYLSLYDREEYLKIASKGESKAFDREWDSTPDRLKVREEVLKSKLSFKKRNLE